MIRRDRRTNATRRDVARPPFEAKGERRGLTTRRVNTATPFVREYGDSFRTVLRRSRATRGAVLEPISAPERISGSNRPLPVRTA